MSPLMGRTATSEGNLGAMLEVMDEQAANSSRGDADECGGGENGEEQQVRSLASHEVTLYILEDDDESTTDQGGSAEGDGAEDRREPLHASTSSSSSHEHNGVTAASPAPSRGSSHHARGIHRTPSTDRNRSRSKSSSSSSSDRSPSRQRSDSKGRASSSQRERDRDRSKSPTSSSKTKRRGSTTSSSRRTESSPSPAPSRHRSRSDAVESKRKASPSPSSSRQHRHRDDDRRDEKRHHSDDRRSRSSSVKKRSGSGDSIITSEMDRSRRTSVRRTRSRTPRSGPDSHASSPKSSSQGHHHHHRHHVSPAPPSTPSRSAHLSGPKTMDEHSHHRPHRSRSASCHRHRTMSDDPSSEARRSRSTSRPSRLPQYSSMQQQQLMRRLSNTNGPTGADQATDNGKPLEPAAYVLSSSAPQSPPLTSSRSALHALSPTSTLRDAILEQTAKQRLLEERGTSPPPQSHRSAATRAPAVGKGSDPPGHYLGSTKSPMVDRDANAQRLHAPDPDAVRGSQVTGQPSIASASSSDVPTTSSNRGVADPDHSTASASTSTSLQLFIRDPAQVNKLVSPRTIVTLDTKDSTLKVKKFGRAHRDDDNSSSDNDDEHGAGDDMSIFSELWGSSVNIAAKVEEEKAVARASNPNMKFDLTSPQKGTTQKIRNPPKKTKSDNSGNRMMRSLSDMLEANMGSLLDSPDRAKRRTRKTSPDRNSPKERSKKNLLWDGTNDDEDDDACSLLLDDENAQKAGDSTKALNDDAISVPPGAVEANNVGHFGKMKEAGASLFKSPSHWLKSPVSAQVRPLIPPPPQPQPEQAPAIKVLPKATCPSARGDSPEISETMATSFDSSLTENSNVAALKPGMSARKERLKKTTVASSTDVVEIDEKLSAFSSILDANSELTKTETPGFTKFVDAAQGAKLNSSAKVSRFPKVVPGFHCPAIGNPLSGVLSTAQRVFRPRRGLSSAEPSTPSPKPKRGVVNCYDMRGFGDDY